MEKVSESRVCISIKNGFNKKLQNSPFQEFYTMEFPFFPEKFPPFQNHDPKLNLLNCQKANYSQKKSYFSTFLIEISKLFNFVK